MAQGVRALEVVVVVVVAVRVRFERVGLHRADVVAGVAGVRQVRTGCGAGRCARVALVSCGAHSSRPASWARRSSSMKVKFGWLSMNGQKFLAWSDLSRNCTSALTLTRAAFSIISSTLVPYRTVTALSSNPPSHWIPSISDEISPLPVGNLLLARLWWMRSMSFRDFP